MSGNQIKNVSSKKLANHENSRITVSKLNSSSHVGTVQLLVLKLDKSRKRSFALAGVAQWIESRTVNKRVTGLIPSQGTHLGCGPGQKRKKKKKKEIEV